MLVAEHVQALPPPALDGHDRVVAEHPQLVGDGRLLHSDRRDDLGHRPRAGAQGGEDLETARRRQREHRVGEPLGGIQRERGRAVSGARIGRGHRRGHRSGGSIEPSTAVSYVWLFI